MVDNKLKFQISNSSAFTLIELLVVITIISILAAIGISTFTPNQIRGRDAQRKLDLRNIQAALEQYHNDQTPMRYPSSVDYAALVNSGVAGSLTNPTKYLKVIPTDPVSTTPYVYHAFKNASGGTCGNGAEYCQEYLLCAKIENTSDSDISKNPCTSPDGTFTVPAGYLYGVKSP